MAVRSESLFPPEVREYGRELRAYLSSLADEYRIPGLCLALSSRGHRLTVAAGDLGTGATAMPADASFELGRIGRLFLSLAVLELVEQGRLNRSAPISEYLRDFKGTDFGRTVCLDHLLADTCGFRPSRGSDSEILRDYSWDRLVESFRHGQKIFEPGEVHSLLIETRALLAAIICRVENDGSATPVHARLLNRLVPQWEQSPGSARVHGHILNAQTGKPVPIPPFGRGDFWRPSFPEVRLNTAELIQIAGGIRNASQRLDRGHISPDVATLLCIQNCKLPNSSCGKGAESPPRSAGMGFHDYGDEWLGLNGPIFGQTVCVRFHRTEPVAFALGANLVTPDVIDRVASDLAVSLDLRQESVARSTQADSGFELEELIGAYTGISGPPIHIRKGGDLVCVIEYRQQLSVELINDKGVWKPRDPSAPVSLGFFRTRQREVGLVSGTLGYKKVTVG